MLGLAAFALAAPAGAADATVVVVPSLDLATYPQRGAVGLLVAGRGTTVSRAEALRLLGAEPEHAAAPVTFYITLPPPGTHRNDRRYEIAVVGPGYHGVLHTPSTRIRGLIPISDVMPSVRALDRGDRPRITAEQGDVTELRDLDRRISDQQHSRNGSVAILSALVVLGSALTLLLRSTWVGRAALLAAPLCVALSIAIAAAGGLRPAVALPVLAGGVVVAALLLGAWRRVGLLCAASIAAFLVVLVAKPTWAALAAIGPNPAEGGRFYGTSNLTATVLVTVALLAARELGPRGVAPVALLALLVVGWSRAGADGGGTLVVLAAFAVYTILLARGRLAARTVALGAAATVALAVAVVAIDAATGGSSHVTRKLGEGPGAVFDELGHRLHMSGDRLAGSWHAALVFALGLLALAVLASRRPRFAAGTALLAAIVVSLIVNDTPQDVASGGAISYGVLFAWERVRSRVDAPRRPGSRSRGLLVAPPRGVRR